MGRQMCVRVRDMRTTLAVMVRALLNAWLAPILRPCCCARHPSSSQPAPPLCARHSPSACLRTAHNNPAPPLAAAASREELHLAPPASSNAPDQLPFGCRLAACCGMSGGTARRLAAATGSASLGLPTGMPCQCRVGA